MPEAIAEMLGAGKCSVERWIAELDEAHRIEWHKNATDPFRRYVLRQSNNDEQAALAAIRTQEFGG